jgi:hypothetical protein
LWSLLGYACGVSTNRYLPQESSPFAPINSWTRHDINIIQSKYIEIQDRAEWIIKKYNSVSVRNGKYSPELLQKKLDFEEFFFKI